MTTYLPRELARPTQEALTELPVVVVTGLRQSGKTTFLREDPTLRRRRYLSLDDFATLEAARRDPDALVAGADPLTIDEAQRCPELLLAIKRAVDRERKPGQYLLSGSANFALLASVGETLAGRALHLTLHPFCRRERLRQAAHPPFLARFLEDPDLAGARPGRPLQASEVLDGGMPPVALGQVRRRGLWFRGYEQTYLERDVRELSQVADLLAFRTVMKLAALRTGTILNASNLARDAKLTHTTTARYLGLLEASYVMQRTPPFLRSKTSRLIKSPKLYVSDSGLAAHLVEVDELGPEEPLRGALFETYAAQNLLAIAGVHCPRWQLGFWSVQGRHEVDFVLHSARACVGIEVKAAARFDERDLTGLRAFLASTSGVRAGVLAYNGEQAVSLGDRLYAIPLSLLLS
jgi:hypothetical protein